MNDVSTEDQAAKWTREVARRVRAARVYADLSQAEMAERLDLGFVTYKRCEAAAREFTAGELKRVAEITNMPDPFFTVDHLRRLAPVDEEAQAALTEARQNVNHLVERLSDLEYRMRRNMDGEQ